jgi:hypothetical protein
MILLDENIPEDQCQLLRNWRFRFRQIGQDTGQQGMKDQEHILPLLHKLNHPTFFTRDLGFFDPHRCHERYCLVCLDVGLKDTARFVRRLLRNRPFDSKAKRMGTVIRVRDAGLLIWRLNASDAQSLPWKP